MEEISGVQTGYARSFALLVGGVLLGTACGKVAHDNESAPLHAAGAKGAADPIDVEGGDEVPVDGDESTEPLPIVPHDGWVDAASNPLAIQGAAFAYADDVSREGMTQDFNGKNACIAGSGARVELSCTPVLPATDCFGTLWGAAIGVNLNQPVDRATGQGLMPQAYDASGLAGFAFTLSGARLPAGMRFKVEDSSDEYCTWKPLQAGRNTVLFSELETECWEHAKQGGHSAVSAQANLIKISWQVVTNTASTTPFDFCVSDVVGLVPVEH